MSRRMRSWAVAGSLAIVGVMLLPFTPGANAAAGTLEVYSARGESAGISLAIAVRPSIFPTLVGVGVPYTRAETSSLAGGSSYALASQMFPGDLAVGGAGCGGIPGTVQAAYPAKCFPKHQAGNAGFRIPAQGEGQFVLDQGRHDARADLGEARGFVTTQRITVRDSAGETTPLLEVRQLRVETDGERNGATVGHVSRMVAQDVVVHAGEVVLRIDTLVSSARASSDGARGDADAELKLSGVTVTLGDQTYDAQVTTTGVRTVGLPATTQEQVDARIETELGRQGVSISAGSPTKVTQDAQADASVGGLVVSFTETLPAVPIPDDVATVIADALDTVPEEITRNRCIGQETGNRGTPADALCVGSGIAPGPGTAFIESVSVGAVQASANAAQPFVLDPGPAFGDNGGFTGGFDGGFTGGNGGFDGGLPPVGDGAAPPMTPGDTGGENVRSGAGAGATPAYGLVATMPSSALAFTGVLFLILALGAVVGPSLRG